MVIIIGKDASEKLMVVRDWIKNVPPSGTTPSKDPPSASQQHVGTLVTDLACIGEFGFRPLLALYLQDFVPSLCA
jgi:hypothetical protein